MHNLKISTLYKHILHYGLFASICHSVILILYYQSCPEEKYFSNFSSFFPLLEHSIVSFICVLLGALLCFYIAKKEENGK